MNCDTLTLKVPKEPLLFVPQGSVTPAPPYCLNQKVKYTVAAQGTVFSGLLQQPCYPLEIPSHGSCANICSSNPASLWSASSASHSPSASPSSHETRPQGGAGGRIRPSGGRPAPLTLSLSPCPARSSLPQQSSQIQNNPPSPHLP